MRYSFRLKHLLRVAEPLYAHLCLHTPAAVLEQDGGAFLRPLGGLLQPMHPLGGLRRLVGY